MEQLKYVSPFSILVIDQTKSLKRIKCPFRVIVIRIHWLGYGKKYLVDRVKQGDKEQLLYGINGCYFEHKNFRILTYKNHE